MLITRAEVSPPTMTMANGRCESDPMACESAAGNSPTVATSMVVMMGRSLKTAPSTAELVNVFEHDNAGLHRHAKQSQEANAGGHTEIGAGKKQRQQAA